MGEPREDREAAAKYPEGDILAVLYRQHADITEGLERVQSETGDARKKNFEEITSFLKAHETAEQTVTRPVTAADDGTQAEQRTEEEEEADATIAELKSMDMDSAEFDKKFATFCDSVSEHSENEENEEFPILEAQSEAVRQELGRAFLDAQSAALA